MLTSELFQKVYQYIDGELTLEQLEDWVVPRLPTLFALPHSSVSDLVATIELGLAEINSEMRSEADFRHLLKEVVQAKTLEIYYLEATQTTHTSSSNEIIFSPFTAVEFTMSPTLR